MGGVTRYTKRTRRPPFVAVWVDLSRTARFYPYARDQQEAIEYTDSIMPWAKPHLAAHIRTYEAGSRGPANREMRLPIWEDDDVCELHSSNNLWKYERGERMSKDRERHWRLAISVLMTGEPITESQVARLWIATGLKLKDPKRTFSDPEVLRACALSGDRCVTCGAPFSDQNGPVGGHAYAHYEGYKTSEGNIIAQCVPCNTAMSGKDIDEYLDVLKQRGKFGRVRLYVGSKRIEPNHASV